MRLFIFILSVLISVKSFAQTNPTGSVELGGVFDEGALSQSVNENPLGNVGAGSVFDTVVEDVPTEGVQSFAKQDAFKNELKEEPVMPEISHAMGKVAIENIINSEQAFCYSVEKIKEGYEGYTLDGFAITGFCGIINKDLQKRIATQFLRTPKNILLDKVEDCSIQPKVIIRFVKGVDYTDVLVSSPCYSYAIFYANKLKAFNAKPMQAFIRSLVEAFEKAKTPFVSPALHNQLVPQGKDLSKKEVKKKPIIIKEIPKPKGWNNLSF